MTEAMIPAGGLRTGDRIGNWCGILVGVTVEDVKDGRLSLRRPDDSTFALTLPEDTMVLVREPRPAERRVAA